MKLSGILMQIRLSAVRLTFICSLCSFLGGTPVQAADDNVLKAALIFKLSHFVTWPVTQANSFSICSDADIKTIRALKKLEQRQIDNRPIRIIELNEKNRNKPSLCDVLYLTKSDSSRIRELLMDVSHDPVLTVSDIKNFSSIGGMIELSSKQSRLHFLVNLKAARDASLLIASPLLEMSTIVAE